ncbi:MAG: hypothetical protein AB7F88_04975 [Pyrinomonadaceae bacterium]
MSEINDLEREFINEQKGEGSLSVYITNGDDADYIGYDIHVEDIEAIYFEGIGVPRWESLQADTVEEQTALYWEKFNERMDSYPMIGRVRDIDKQVDYSADEVQTLTVECDGLAEAAAVPKALRSLQKLAIAANRASGQGSGLSLKQSKGPAIPSGF